MNAINERVKRGQWNCWRIRFEHLATDRLPYMYHCHILEHENRGMMGQFTVT